MNGKSVLVSPLMVKKKTIMCDACIVFECSYTWQIYATKVLNMASMYGFWRTMNKEERQAKQRYLQMFYNLQFRKLVS